MGDAIQFEKFVKFLKIKSKVRYDAKKDYYRVYFKNKRFKAQLFARGYRPLKTNLMRLPSQEVLPVQLLNHFVRGYYDKKGSFVNNEDGTLLEIYGCEFFLSELKRSFVENEIFVKSYVEKMGKSRFLYKLSLKNAEDILFFLNWMYKDATVYSDRPYSQYRKFLAENGQRKRRIVRVI